VGIKNMDKKRKKSTKKNEKKGKKYLENGLGKHIGSFQEQVEALSKTADIIMEEVNRILIKNSKNLTKWIEHESISTSVDKDTMEVKISPRRLGDFQKELKTVTRFAIAYKLWPRNFVVSLISLFDAYLGGIFRWILEHKPEVLKASERNITYGELLSFQSFKQARNHIIEREIDSLLRKSHAQHFEWLEDKLGIPLRQGLKCWTNFIELTERRNLYVHCDGMVSRQYLQECKKHNVQLDKPPKIGEKLFVKKDYFDRACKVILEIAIKLGHVVWRKLEPSQSEDVDNSMNHKCVDLIESGEYDLVIELLEFVTNCEAWRASEEMSLYFQLNLAQAYKWKGDKEKCNEILSKRDFATLNDKYRLANAVLLDDFQAACSIMKDIGKKGEVGEIHYAIWPIFREFRKRPEFEETYKRIFGEDFKVSAEKPEQVKLSKSKKKAKKKKRAAK
jgi:hypothetical protein